MKSIGKILWSIAFLLCAFNESNGLPVLDAAPSSLHNDSFNGTSNHNTICLSKECIKMAGFILDNLDSTVDPCRFFFRFDALFFKKIFLSFFYIKVKISINLLVALS